MLPSRIHEKWTKFDFSTQGHQFLLIPHIAAQIKTNPEQVSICKIVFIYLFYFIVMIGDKSVIMRGNETT